MSAYFGPLLQSGHSAFHPNRPGSSRLPLCHWRHDMPPCSKCECDVGSRARQLQPRGSRTSSSEFWELPAPTLNCIG